MHEHHHAQHAPMSYIMHFSATLSKSLYKAKGVDYGHTRQPWRLSSQRIFYRDDCFVEVVYNSRSIVADRVPARARGRSRLLLTCGRDALDRSYDRLGTRLHDAKPCSCLVSSPAVPRSFSARRYVWSPERDFLALTPFLVWNLRWPTRAQQNDAIAIRNHFQTKSATRPDS